MRKLSADNWVFKVMSVSKSINNLQPPRSGIITSKFDDPFSSS